MGGNLPGVPDKLRLQVNSALVCQDHDRPQAVRQFMTEFRLAVVDTPDTSVCLDQFGQIAHVSYETERKFSRRPDAPLPLDLKLFVEIV